MFCNYSGCLKKCSKLVLIYKNVEVYCIVMCSMFAGGPINYLLDKTQNNKHTVGQQKDCTSRLCHVSV